jgi:hypothetical protein
MTGGDHEGDRRRRRQAEQQARALAFPGSEPQQGFQRGGGEVGLALRQRFDGLLDRVGLYIPFVPGQMDGFWRKLAADLR